MSGYKTYIVCAVTIIYAIIGVYLGSLDLTTGSQMVLAALGAAGLRHAISTSTQ